MEPLDEPTRANLLALARGTLERELLGRTDPLPALPQAVADQQPGLFVTLKEGGRLRGCIGHLVGRMPLAQAIPEVAAAAAFEDARFDPLRAEELPEVQVELSLLTPPVPVADWRDIVLGRHGILLRLGHKEAAFLPQVPAEEGWTRSDTLAALSRKAGLPSDAWRRSEAVFEVFEALHFAESHRG